MTPPQTLAQKLLAQKANQDHVEEGEVLEVPVDVAMAHEALAQLVKPFNEMGAKEVWDREKIVVPIDHWVPASSESSAKMHHAVRDFVREHDLPHFYDVGNQGICHQILVEEGFVLPGDLVVGTDSHTNMAGAMGAFACGIGPTEMAAVFATGEIWLKVPRSIRVEVTGELTFPVTGKDVILEALGQLTTEGARYMAVEFGGSAVDAMAMYERFTMTNMTTELGAKAGLIAADDETLRYLDAIDVKNDRRDEVRTHAGIRPDEDAAYAKRITIDGSTLTPRVAKPRSPDNVEPVSDVTLEHVDQVFVGSCTNARLEDLRLVASILDGHHVAPDTRLLVYPASTSIYKQALKEGIIETIVEAGGTFNPSSCGACFGGMGGVMDKGETCVSTSNRNFPGRMGHVESMSYLVSPATAAVTAITGELTDPTAWFRDDPDLLERARRWVAEPSVSKRPGVAAGGV